MKINDIKIEICHDADFDTCGGSDGIITISNGKENYGFKTLSEEELIKTINKIKSALKLQELIKDRIEMLDKWEPFSNEESIILKNLIDKSEKLKEDKA